MRFCDRIEFFERETFLDFFLILFGMDDVAFANTVFSTFGNEFDEIVLGHRRRVGEVVEVAKLNHILKKGSTCQISSSSRSFF